MSCIHVDYVFVTYSKHENRRQVKHHETENVKRSKHKNLNHKLPLFSNVCTFPQYNEQFTHCFFTLVKVVNIISHCVDNVNSPLEPGYLHWVKLG